MRRSDNHVALTDEVARFQAEVRRLAFAAAHAIIREEIDRRLAKPEPARPRAAPPSRPDAAVAVAPAPREPPPPPAPITHEQLQLLPPSPPTPPTPPAGSRKHPPWTRESIIKELASWMLSGTVIDAPFVTRHGPPGLVAATRRVFGRFEAALNVAGLHVSKLYPDGPPSHGPPVR